jgi:hypothetical protein
MKTLSSALRDGDHIEYIIRETGVNQDGKTPGITMRKLQFYATALDALCSFSCPGGCLAQSFPFFQRIR